MKEKVFNTIDNIRNLLSKPFIFNELTKDTIKFNKCYASLDILEDSEQAIDYYKNTDFEIDNYGQKYLFIYGLFEAFYIQEQAIRCVIEIANINNDNVKIELDKLGNIKKLRNDIKSLNRVLCSYEFRSFYSLTLPKIRKFRMTNVPNPDQTSP